VYEAFEDKTSIALSCAEDQILEVKIFGTLHFKYLYWTKSKILCEIHTPVREHYIWLFRSAAALGGSLAASFGRIENRTLAVHEQVDSRILDESEFIFTEITEYEIISLPKELRYTKCLKYWILSFVVREI